MGGLSSPGYWASGFQTSSDLVGDMVHGLCRFVSFGGLGF